MFKLLEIEKNTKLKNSINKKHKEIIKTETQGTYTCFCEDNWL